jgi:cell division protease FtsH
MKRNSGGVPQRLFGLNKAKAKVYVEKDTKTTFSDVAGVDEAKEELKEIVSFLDEPKKYSRLGGRAPKGILLIGPPGTEKTLLARALAGEAKAAFLSINSSEFVEMFVGLGAARVRDLFIQSRTLAPCILFIDEIDALGKARGSGMLAGGHDEKEQTLNQLLAEMDGFDTSEGILILASTNRPEVLDPALLRAGRFDRQVLVNIPDKVGRTQILRVHSKKIQLDPSVTLEHISALTPGFSGADLANLVNEAAVFATRRNAETVMEKDFTMAIERSIAGLEQKSKLMNPDEKRRIAFHEMGHTTAALSLGATDKVHKVSIIPRGMGALGYTLQRPSMATENTKTRISLELVVRAPSSPDSNAGTPYPAPLVACSSTSLIVRGRCK